MTTLIIFLGLAVGTYDLIRFYKTNEIKWLLMGYIQLALVAFLIFLQSLI